VLVMVNVVHGAMCCLPQTHCPPGLKPIGAARLWFTGKLALRSVEISSMLHCLQWLREELWKTPGFSWPTSRHNHPCRADGRQQRDWLHALSHKTCLLRIVGVCPLCSEAACGSSRARRTHSAVVEDSRLGRDMAETFDHTFSDLRCSIIDTQRGFHPINQPCIRNCAYVCTMGLFKQ
jgi:hypothetical protein